MGDENKNPILRFEDVTVLFGRTRALDRVSFEVFPGDSCIILGVAGSGKTTLLKAAIGLVCPTSGRTFLFGEEISRMKEHDLYRLRSRVGILFQEGGLFDSFAVAENVAYPLQNQELVKLPPEQVLSRVQEALSFVELEHTMDKYPSELSGGMRRRVGIARAVVTEPELVLYDSPTAGLDPITANTIIALVIKERDLKNTTTMMVTHRYQDGQLLANFRYNPEKGQIGPARDRGSSDVRTRFMVLREGHLVFVGTQEELESSTDPYVSKFVRR